MRMTPILLAITATALATQHADASSWMDGMRLLHECQLAIRTADGGQRLSSDEDASSSHCIGYIQGVLDTNALWDEIDKRDHQTARPHYCIATNVSLEQGASECLSLYLKRRRLRDFLKWHYGQGSGRSGNS